MGRIADSLRANLREVAKSDARSLKEMDEELRSATQFPGTPLLKQNKKVKALLGQGSWDQTNKTLQGLCRDNRIKKCIRESNKIICILYIPCTYI